MTTFIFSILLVWIVFFLGIYFAENQGWERIKVISASCVTKLPFWAKLIIYSVAILICVLIGFLVLGLSASALVFGGFLLIPIALGAYVVLTYSLLKFLGRTLLVRRSDKPKTYSDKL
ncbi:hypothetical protein HQ393_09325 [Chitinibacter bivalviorum]|uniref:Uncharacterized protein n=1 Tax=Chitinibacter bivalviorum TaxID=2739434 RepID=A0A7H9BK82_9NEIS|nr:hypothetical protein [Chitinibacter bivalviorum]QLG88431.1 hypothetical protein HQ393_09325 [Chitinibacter bivalviorum]